MTDEPRPGPGPDRPLWGPRPGPVVGDLADAPQDADVEPSTRDVTDGPPTRPPAPAAVPPATPPAAGRSRLPLVLGVVGLVVGLVVVGVVAVRSLRTADVSGTVDDGRSGPSAAAPAVPTPSPGPARAPSASAACVSAPSMDAAGATVTYDPAEVLDGRLDTAWRCDGDGVGQQLRVDLGRRLTLTGVGIVPGYAKTDPADGADRYAQNRRIAQVRYTFDDGTAVEQQLDTDPGDRAVQTLNLTAVTTTGVTLTVLASVPGQQVGGYPPSEKIAISELQVVAS